MELSNVTSSMSSARAAMSYDAFERSALALGARRNEVREAFQAGTATHLRVIMERVASGQPLSDEDVATIRQWIVGDADSYLRHESDLEGWIEEYARLEGVLAEYEGRPLTEGDLLELKGILEDAVRVAHDIANLLEKRERVQRFDGMIGERDSWSREERQRLVGLLKGKLESQNR